MTQTKNYLGIIQSVGLLGIALGVMIVFTPLMFLSKYIGDDAAMLIYYAVSMGVAFCIAYVVRRRITGQKIFNFSVSDKGVFPFIIVGMIALQMGVSLPVIEMIPMPEAVKQLFMEVLGGTGIFAFIMMVIAAPVLEELLFRGIILDGLLKRYSPLKSILISSMFFGIFHFNPWQLVAAFVLGFFSGWIYYRTKSITLSIVVHTVNNLAAFTAGFFLGDSSMETSVELYGGVTNYILIIAVCIIVACACIFFLRKRFGKNNFDESDTQPSVELNL